MTDDDPYYKPNSKPRPPPTDQETPTPPARMLYSSVCKLCLPASAHPSPCALRKRPHSPPPSRFLALPAEIRLEIYELVVRTRSKIQIQVVGEPHDGIGSRIRFGPPLPALFQTCRQIRHELSVAEYHTTNTFIINDSMLQPSITAAFLRSNPSALQHFRRIRLIMRVRTAGDDLLPSLGPWVPIEVDVEAQNGRVTNVIKKRCLISGYHGRRGQNKHGVQICFRAVATFFRTGRALDEAVNDFVVTMRARGPLHLPERWFWYKCTRCGKDLVLWNLYEGEWQQVRGDKVLGGLSFLGEHEEVMGHEQ